jgi:hypothetical protein
MKFLILSGACLLGSGIALAQAPAGPISPPPSAASTADPAPPAPKRPGLPPRKNILGAWRFNKEESDDGRAKLRQAHDSDNPNRNGGYGNGPRMGGPWPGGPMGGPGHGGPRNTQADDVSDRLGDLVNPPRELRLTRHFDSDPEVDLTDDRMHRKMFYTDGRKLEKQKDPSNQEISAHWDDDRLVTDEKGTHGGKLSRTFEISKDGRQLLETIHITDSKGNHPVMVQYVYDAVEDSSLSFSSH